MSFTVEQIARVCHEAGRAIQVITDDESPAQPWDAEVPEMRESVIAGVQAAMSGMTPEELHENWCRWKTAHGWQRGDVKDPDAKTHPCLVPYGELPEGQRVKDRVFAGIVAAMTAGVRDRQGEQDHAEFSGWLAAQGFAVTDPDVHDDLFEAFRAGMQAARDLATAQSRSPRLTHHHHSDSSML